MVSRSSSSSRMEPICCAAFCKDPNPSRGRGGKVAAGGGWGNRLAVLATRLASWKLCVFRFCSQFRDANKLPRLAGRFCESLQKLLYFGDRISKKTAH